MIVKVTLGTLQNARKLVSIAEQIPYDVELCSGRYTVDAKSMLGVLSMPELGTGELYIHTDKAAECIKILKKLQEAKLLSDTPDCVRRSGYDITVFGEIQLDFTCQGMDEKGQAIFIQNPGGALANVAVTAGRLGAHTAFLGKVGQDLYGEFLSSALQKEKIEIKGLVLDKEYSTTLAFANVSAFGTQRFSLAGKPGADNGMQREEIDIDILDNTSILHVGSTLLTAEPGRDTTFYAVKRARSKGSIISYVPDYRADMWKDGEVARHCMRSLIPYVDVMEISKNEISLLTNKESVEAAAAALYMQGVKIVVASLGKEGIYIYCKDGGRRMPGLAGSAEDINGVRDCFWGGFLYRISSLGKNPDEITMDELEKCICFANAPTLLPHC